jgi:hypothetical protein
MAGATPVHKTTCPLPEGANKVLNVIIYQTIELQIFVATHP